ncbi:MAG: hypothetical protein ABIW76_11315 [Fibrobacteria bacterium]
MARFAVADAPRSRMTRSIPGITWKSASGFATERPTAGYLRLSQPGD